MEVYETVKLIGSGAFGQVYLVKHKREDKMYVNKKIKTRDMSQKDRENTENEVRLLQKLRHANIVAYKDSYMDREQYLNIVMIHCEGGDMHNRIKNQKGKNFPEDQIQDWLAQMALALFYLHEKKILHRDLKTQNIFLKSGRVRLGDFGIAKVLDSTRDFANTCIGTPYYMSPELFKYKPYSYKSDIWSFGCVLYEMCNLRHAFDAQSLNGLAVKIMNGTYPPINSTYSKSLRDLIGKMLQLNPKSRPSILDIINTSFVKRRIITYITDLLSGNLTDPNIINDVDDLYFDSLRDQAQKLGVLQIINQNLSKNGPALPISDELLRPPQRVGQRQQGTDKKVIEQKQKAKKELQKQINEKNRIEQEIKRLEKKKMVRSSSTNIKQPQQQNQQSDARQNVKKTENDHRDKKERDRSYSFERESSVNKRKPQQNQQQQSGTQSKSSVNSIRNEVKKVRQQLDSSQSTSAESDIHPTKVIPSVRQSVEQNYNEQKNVDRREQIRQEQERKRKQEQEEMEQQRKQIIQENIQARQRAVQLKQAQYRPSRDNMVFMNEEEEKQQQQQNQMQGISKKGSLQSIEYSKKQNGNPVDDFSIDINERDSFEYKSSIDQNSNIYNSERYAPPMQNNSLVSNNYQDERESQQQPQQRPQQYPYNIQEEEDQIMDINEIIGENNEENDDDALQSVIHEEENEESDDEVEEDPNKIEEKLELMKTKLKEKTIKINTITNFLNQSKKQATLQKNQISQQMQNQDQEEGNVIPEDQQREEDDNNFYDDEDLDDDANYDENEGEVIQEFQQNNNPQYFKIQDKIKLFRHRCEASLGIVMFDKAYDYLKVNNNKCSTDELRKQLVEILSEENIGFWHLIDQILFLEEVLLTIPSQIQK
ncbi:hypothetical protein ABPG72_001905 [Tetrahymena utriculariae]